MVHRPVQHASAPLSHIGFVVFVIAFIALVSNGSGESKQYAYTNEAAFADNSASGMFIVPASCPSDPHYAGHCSCPELYASSTDGLGKVVDTGPSRRIREHNYFRCVTNASGGTYFVPAKTAEELNSFFTNPPPGVTIESP